MLFSWITKFLFFIRRKQEQISIAKEIRNVTFIYANASIAWFVNKYKETIERSKEMVTISERNSLVEELYDIKFKLRRMSVHRAVVKVTLRSVP